MSLLKNVLTFIMIAVFCAVAYGDYQLVWSDEFDGPDIDTSNWNFETGGNWYNNEIQFYTDRPENARIENGNLVIEARKEVYENRNHTSARMTTQYKQSFKYGMIEARIKMADLADGLWPAFWLMGENIDQVDWPDCGEIDIMEMGSAEAISEGTVNRKVGATAHWEHAGGYAGYGLTTDTATAAYNDYHLFRLTWTPTMITAYLDDTAYWLFDISGGAGSDLEEFHEDMFILLNMAVGGNYTGITNPAQITALTVAEPTEKMYIDYVRVYQDDNIIPPAVTITNPSDGAILPAGNIVIDATASDSDGSVATVEFYEGANYLGEDTTSPYSVTWTSAPNGIFTITAKAIDNEGLSNMESISLTVGTGIPDQLPYHGTPFALPTRIEAEDYDTGGEGVAYHDNDGGNNGGQYRYEDVDIENCSEGGYNVAWMGNNEWLEYTVDVPEAGEYKIDIRVASQSTGGNFHIEFDGIDITGNINVPVTGGWQSWTTVSAIATLSAGTQTMRFVNANSNDAYNINYFDISTNFIIDPPHEFIWIEGQSVTDCLSASNGQEPYHDWLAIPSLGGFDWSALDSSLFVGGSGVGQGWREDDRSWNYTLPFSFNFYGTIYNSVNVCDNGFVDFTTFSTDYSNSTSELIQNVRIAPLWDDLVTDGDSSYDIFIDESVPGQVTIRWRGERYWGDSQVRFAVVLFDDGSIRFDYGGDNTNLSPTVGLSAGNGSDYVIVPGYDGVTTLTNANSVLFTPIPGESPLPPGVNLNPITGCFEGAPETAGSYSAIIEVWNSSESYRTTQHRFDFQVIENTPPVADAGDDITVSVDDDCMALVTLDGSDSYDPDGNPLTYQWFYDGELFAEGAVNEVQLELGEHVFTLIVNDGTEDSEPSDVLVTVYDDMPLELSVTMSHPVLWPANNKMVEMWPIFEVDNGCRGEVSIELIEITCDQPSEKDIQTDDGVLLRAKRLGSDKAGRTYTLVYQATDGAGNETIATAEVNVPHDKGKRKKKK